ncbi:O-antigen ligase family protein [Myroides odoratimimus]|uniref:O-antigen ligase family protein n=1 Tax=Myroides odoratimimus TaxID=76832 RepID=UPI0025769877|nr:O-antigen ligase family protein [Myroides odoratimimus]MDM1517656.1 O-antigen ligase family protein [Myroides odoratimimus]
MWSNKYIPVILIVSQIFGLYGGMLQIPRVFAIVFLPILISNFNQDLLKQRRVFYFFFVFIFHCLFSIFLAKEHSDSVLKEFCYAIINFIIFLEIVNFSISEKENTLFKSWIFFVALTIPIALFEIKFNIHFPSSKFGNDDIIGGVGMLRTYAAINYGNYNLYNYILSVSFPIVLIGFKLLKHIRSKIFYSIIPISVLYIVLINGSRGALVCLLLCMLIYIMLFSSKKMMKRVFLFFITSIVFLLVFLSNNFSYIGTRIEAKGLEDNKRLEMINIGLDMLIDSNLLGVGPGNFERVAGDYTTGAILAPHNVFIEVLAQYGLFVFFLFIILILYCFPLNLIFRYKDNRQIILIMTLFTFLIAHTINSVYLSNPYFWIFLATLYSLSYQLKNK